MRTPLGRLFIGAVSASLCLAAAPAAAQSPTPFPQVAFGGFHGCALSAAGAVSCWGENTRGQLGDGSGVDKRSTPKGVTGLGSGVAAIASGYLHSCALTTAGGVRCWGENASGQLGDGTLTRRTTPSTVFGLSSGVVAIAAGGNHSCALLASGGLRCWGENVYGQLGAGDGSFGVNRSNPVPVSGFSTGAISVSVGGHHTCAVRADGTLWCWGQNWARQLGTSAVSRPEDVPRQVMLPSAAAKVSLGWEHSCALLASGGAMCWGLNDHGQLGNPPIGTPTTGPVDVLGLTGGVAAISAGYYHNCALTTGGGTVCWGSNSFQERGMLGDGTATDRLTPQVVGLAGGALFVEAGAGNSAAVASDGSVLAWGSNRNGEVGDGTFIDRWTPQLVSGIDGAGYLDLTPADGQQLPATRGAAFPVVSTASNDGSAVFATSRIQFRAEDLGKTASVYVFALAPQDKVRPAAGPVASEPLVLAGKARDDAKADPVPCVLAQLTASGQLQQVSASNVQAYVTGVLSAQGATVNLLNGVNPANVAGSTFYVGYGTNPSQATDGGNNRSVVSVPGSRECRPQPPQTGWWWNPAEGGRGYSIETSGNRLFMAAFLYDAGGRATWSVASGPTTFDGSLFTGRLLEVANGQTLTGAYRKPAPITDLGSVTLAFTDATRGTLVWPGGAVPIERFNIVPNGLKLPAQVNQPETGWWWNPQEDGRGFFMEWQGGSADLAGYMYDDAGNPVWYISVFPTPDPRRFDGTWWLYGGGQSMTGAYRPATRINDNVGPATIRFSGASEAILTLPGGATTRFTRYRF